MHKFCAIFLFFNNIYSENFFFNPPCKYINISEIIIEIPYIEFNFSILNFEKYETEVNFHFQSLNYFYLSVNKLFFFNIKLPKNLIFYLNVQVVAGWQSKFFGDSAVSIYLKSKKHKHINLSIGYYLKRRYFFIKYDFIKYNKISFSLYSYINRKKSLNNILKKYEIKDSVKESLIKVINNETIYDKRNIVYFDEKYYTSAHEAGHAIAGYLIGYHISYIDIIPVPHKREGITHTKGGYHTEQSIKDKIVFYLAGIIAEEMIASQISEEERTRMGYDILFIDKIDEIIKNTTQINPKNVDLIQTFKYIDIILENSDEEILNEFHINEDDTEEIKRKKILIKCIKSTQNLLQEHKKEHEILTRILVQRKELTFNEKFTFEHLMKAIKEYIKNYY